MERKRWRLVEEEEQAGSETAFWAYGQTLTTTRYFFYLGGILRVMDNDWLEVIGNLCEARRIWERFLWILGMEGEETVTLGYLYLDVVREILFFGLEMWVVTPCIGMKYTIRSQGG